ncbi:MAG: methyl-accepting chemotaxis protein, partial [Pseudomonadota bacterium]
MLGLTAIFAIAVLVSLNEGGKAATADRLAAQIDGARSTFLLVRQEEKDFLLDKDPARIERAGALLEEVRGRIAASRDHVLEAGVEGAVERIDRLAQGTEAYAATLAALHQANIDLGLTEKLGLEGDLRSSVHGVEKRINEFGDFEMKSKMLMMRRHEKDFMMRGGDKYVTRLNDRVAEFKAFPDDKYDGPGQRAEVEALLDDYRNSFVAFAGRSVEERALRAKTTADLAALTPVLEDLRASAAAHQGAAANAARAASFGGFGFAALCALVGVAFFHRRSKRLAGRIGGALSETNGVMLRLADGDLDVEPPSAEYRELQEISSALATFRENGRARIRLEEEAKAAKLEREAARREEAERAEEARRREEAERAERAAEEERRREEARIEAESARKEREEEEREARARMLATVRSSIEDVVSAAVAGDLSGRIDENGLDDELKDVARAINELLVRVNGSLTETSDVLGRLSEGDLTRRIAGEYEGVFLTLKDTVNASLDRLTALIDQISESSATVSQGSSSIRSAADDLSRRTESNAATLEETTAALEEFSKSVANVAGSIGGAAGAAKTVRDKAENIGALTKEAARSIDDIAERSSEIEHVISLIEDISFQINLLALNAGVEAARAGEA